MIVLGRLWDWARRLVANWRPEQKYAVRITTRHLAGGFGNGANFDMGDGEKIFGEKFWREQSQDVGQLHWQTWPVSPITLLRDLPHNAATPYVFNFAHRIHEGWKAEAIRPAAPKIRLTKKQIDQWNHHRRHTGMFMEPLE